MTALYYMYYSFQSQFYFSNPNDLSDVLESGAFQDIALKGVTPTMNYKEGIIDGFIAALRKRFNLDHTELDVVSSTRILYLKN